MTPEMEDVVSRFDACSRGLLESFLELWTALRDLAERSPGSVPLPRVTVDDAPGSSSLARALRFLAGVDELLGQVADLHDRNVVAARAGVMHYSHGLCQALAEIERLVDGEEP